MRGSYPEASQPEPALQFEAELGSAARQAYPRRVAVRVVKAAGEELGLFFTERGGHHEVTGYKGALADAIAVDAAGLPRVRSKVSATRGVPRAGSVAPGDRCSEDLEGR